MGALHVLATRSMNGRQLCAPSAVRYRDTSASSSLYGQRRCRGHAARVAGIQGSRGVCYGVERQRWRRALDRPQYWRVPRPAQGYADEGAGPGSDNHNSMRSQARCREELPIAADLTYHFGPGDLQREGNDLASAGRLMLAGMDHEGCAKTVGRKY